MKHLTTLIAFGIAVAALALAPTASANSLGKSTANLEAQITQAIAALPAGEVLSSRGLQGLDPAHYLLRRRPEPEAARELARWIDANPRRAALLARELQQGLPGFSAPPASAYGRRSAAQIAALADQERRAYAEGVLLALGRSGDPLALPVLAAFVADASQPMVLRGTAAVALGRSGDLGATSVLVALAEGGHPDDESLRANALTALGSLRSDAALAALMGASVRLGSPVLQQAAIAALGAQASTWITPRDSGAALNQRRAAEQLVRLVLDDRHVALETQILEAASLGPQAIVRAALAAAAPAASKEAQARASRLLARLR